MSIDDITWTEYLTDVVEYIIIPRFANNIYKSYMAYRMECPVGRRDSYMHKKIDIASVALNYSRDDYNDNNEGEDGDSDIHCFEIKISTRDMNTGMGRNYYGDFNWIVVPHYLYWNAINFRDNNFPYINIIYVDGDIGEAFSNKNKSNDLINFEMSSMKSPDEYRGVYFDNDLPDKIATNIYNKNCWYSNINRDNNYWFHRYTENNYYDECLNKYKELYIQTPEYIKVNGIYRKYNIE